MQTGSKEWAHRLIAKHKAGDAVPLIALRMAHSVVGTSPSKQAQQQITEVSRTDSFVPDDESYFED